MLNEYLPDSARLMADSLMEREGLLTRSWSYDYGVVWRGMELLYARKGGAQYLTYAKDAMDVLVDDDGRISGYDRQSFNLDHLCNGRTLLWLWRETGLDKYRLAADLLRSQLSNQPRTSDGGFWHKKIYPWQMWLDGQHMAIPFYVDYTLSTGGPAADLDDAAEQLLLAWRHTYDPATGLNRHAWDEKCRQPWADPASGQARHAWGRAVGWYLVALADSLALLPRSHARFHQLQDVLESSCERLLDIREQGVWNQVLDCPGRAGNYLESSGSCLMTYAMLSAAENGLLPQRMGDQAAESFLALQRQFVGRMRDGRLFLAKCCQGAGLGGATRRDGSFDYYISEPIVSYDLKGTGAYIQAAVLYESRG